MKRSCLALVLIVPFLLASPAWALFDAQVLTGKRSTDFKISGQSNTESGNELKAAAHLDPIPLVPIGVGLSLSQLNWDDSSKLGYKSIEGNEIGAEVEAWLPIELGGFQVYGKLGYTLLGAYKIKFEDATYGDYSVALKSTGSYVAVGLKYLFLFRLGVMLEYEAGNRKLNFDEIKSAPAALDISALKKDITATSSSFLLGVQAGL